MQSKAKMFLAKLLIIFSVIFIGIGVVLTLFSDDKVFHPIYDVTLIASTENEKISITTAASDEKDESIVENNVSSTNIDNSSIQNAVTNTEVVSPTIDDVNEALRKEIEKNYGVKVKYAKETLGYSVGGMKTTEISDATISQKALLNLNLALALYPKGFFQEIKSKGLPLTFYLVKCYSTDNVTGVTDSSNKNIVISIATDYDFIDTFHHEIYHYIEKSMIASGATFTSWGTLNPVGFKYGVIDSSYSYARTFSSDAFFVNSYAMTDQYEDRASTFEYMMKSSKASCLNYGNTVWLKAKTMSEQIDYFFSSVNSDVTEYWERHIY